MIVYSKKLRACSSCMHRWKATDNEECNVLDTDIEQSLDIPHPKVLGLASPPSDMNLSMVSSSTSLGTIFFFKF